MEAADIIKKIFPEFAGADQKVVEMWINFSRSDVSKSKFGEKYEYAVALIACHKMKLNGLGKGLAGSQVSLMDIQGVSSVSEGETSISFDHSGDADASSLSAEYKKTMYGMQFLALRSQKLTTIMISNK